MGAVNDRGRDIRQAAFSPVFGLFLLRVAAGDMPAVGYGRHGRRAVPTSSQQGLPVRRSIGEDIRIGDPVGPDEGVGGVRGDGGRGGSRIGRARRMVKVVRAEDPLGRDGDEPVMPGVLSIISISRGRRVEEARRYYINIYS